MVHAYLQIEVRTDLYGKKQENLHLTFDYQTFRKTWKEAGSSSIVNLQVDGESEPREVMIHHIDYNPLTDEFQHIDLKQVERGKKMVIKVPIVLVGESPAIKNLSGVLTHGKTEVEMKCLPRDLLKEIEIDIAVLEEFGQSVRVEDLKIDAEKYEILEEADTMLVSVIAPKTQEQIDEEEAEDAEAGETAVVSEDVAAEAEEEQAAAQASKESDTEKKGGEK